MRKLLDFETNATFIITALVALILVGFLNTPILLNLELNNIFNSFLINDSTNHIITTNLEATAIPPLFYWLEHIVISVFGLDFNILKLIPVLAMIGIIIVSFLFIIKQTALKKYGVILSLILATSPFFIAASKIISPDLLYVFIYMTTGFIFINNVFNSTYSNLSTFIAGILLAVAFSLTGFVGSAPILANFILINFIRGGFFINLKFNNPITLTIGFAAFIVIWLTSLGKQVGIGQAFDIIFNYHSLEAMANFKFDEGKFAKYAVLFIIGGFPWIAMLPSAVWGILANLPSRQNTSNIKISLPFICLINAILLGVYYSTVEQEFYILLTIYLNIAILIADRITDLEFKNISIINILYFILTIIIMFLFINDFSNINLTSFSLQTDIQELLINDHTSTTSIPQSAIYFIILSYSISTICLCIFATSRKDAFLDLTLISSVISFSLVIFTIFPNLKNPELNQKTNDIYWFDNIITQETDSIIFYKEKDTILASKANNVFYFDNLGKTREFINNNNLESIYIYFNAESNRSVPQLNHRALPICRSNKCILQVQ